jgi:hypothetical protein|tara:strand:+ start:297 stop:1454 length:1158 start_codon:yes stop_codon:yes gene_type:complete
MLKNLQKILFPLIITFSAIAVSASAAFYSISGLSKLFAGAAFAVIIMAASLEIAKLVIASLLYQYRKTLPKFLKYYLSIACVVLILITSMGIYGFLSAAYQETSAKAGNIDAQVTLIEVKRDNIKEQLFVYNEEKSSINEAVTSLRNGLSNNKIQYTDTSGNVVTTTSSSTRRALEKQLDQAINRQTTINNKVDILNEKLFNYETEIVEVKTNDNISGELGPLKYLSGLTGFPMDRIINWLLLTIIFVFDPLAIALVIAANFAFDQVKSKKTNFISQAIKVIQPKKVKMSVPEGMEFNKSYPIPQDDGEERMNIIGQNGNDGLHYDELTDAEKKLDLNKDGILDQFELDRDAKIESLKLMKVNGDRDSQWVENEIANLPTKPPLT